MSQANRRDVQKERYWQRIIVEAARSGQSIREFCRRRRLKESQFYWWQRNLKERQQEGKSSQKIWGKDTSGDQKTFALVSDESGTLETGVELVLNNGRRLEISKGVDEATLRAVLPALEADGC
jgi:transposase-like protein